MEFMLTMYRQSSESYSEQCSLVSHSLQVAAAAMRAGESRRMIAACLLHDIGHLVMADDTDGCGHAAHAVSGAQFLRFIGCDETVCRLIEGHAQAKRYLCYADKGYMHALSEASKRTLRFQGGPMTAREATAFDRDPLRDEMLRLRMYDDMGKQSVCDLGGIDCHRDLLRPFFSRRSKL